MFFKSVLTSMVLLSALVVEAAPRCRPETSWKTVSNWQLVPGKSAMMAGLVTYGQYAFAAGLAGDGTQGNWVVRRSTNNGNTWNTVYSQYGAGRGIAVDKRNGTLYTIGINEDGGVGNEWIVKKSTDHGLSWSEVDNFVEPSHSYLVTRITVDGKGNVIVIGYDAGFGGEQAPIMRRSENAGANWITINYSTAPFTASNLAATIDGAVFVVGGVNVTPTSNKWVVLYSPDGKNTWSTVDDFIPNPSSPNSGAFARGARIASDGTIIVVGTGSLGTGTGSLHMVRKSHISTLSTWTTLDAYQPFSFSEGFGNASAAALTFGRFNRIFTNGTESSAGSDFSAAISRQGNIMPGSFMRSDRVLDPAPLNAQYEFIYSGGIDTLSNMNILSGHLQELGTSRSWLIRKMSCNL